MIHFAFPLVFLLLPLPFVVRKLSSGGGTEDGAALKVPFFYELKSVSGGTRSVFRPTRLFALSAAWVCLVTAAARPQVPAGMQSYLLPVRDVMLVLDVSGSMMQQDFSARDGRVFDRLSAAKVAADGFISSRKGDRIGIVLFAGQAALYVPPTVDYPTLREMLSAASVGLLGERTAIGDAVGLAAETLKESAAEMKVAVLLTDGVNNAGSLMPLDALVLAKRSGMKIYTVGAGGSQDAPDGFDAEILKRMAKETGGEFYMADDVRGLERAYESISSREPLSETAVYLMPQKELYPYPLFCFFCFVSLIVLKRLASVALFRMKGRRHE